MTDGDEEPRLRRFLVSVAVFGVVLVGASVALVWTRGGFASPWLLLFVAVVVGVTSLLEAELPLGERALSMNLVEVGVVVGFALLPAAEVPGLVVLGMVAADLFRRLRPEQVLFNAASTGGATVVAAVGIELLAGSEPVQLDEVAGLVVMVVAVVLYAIVNLVLAGLLLQRLNDMTFRLTMRSIAVSSMVTLGLAGSLGVLAALLLQIAPLAIPFLVLPTWLVARVLAERVDRILDDLEQHDRLERTVEGVSDGIALLDREGVVLLANPVFHQRLGTSSEELLGTPLGAALERLTGGADARAEFDRAVAQLTPDAPRASRDLPVGGRILTLVCSGLFDRIGTGTGMVALLLDVTDERETEWLRRDFIARVSHELRTPLTAILGFAETLHVRDGQLSGEERRHYLDVVHRQSRRLDRLVTTLLWSARIERARAASQRGSVRLADAVPAVLQALGDLPAGDIEVAVGDTAVEVDPDHLDQVLVNLLVNAHTYGRPPVRVTAVEVGARVEVAISDAGDGVPERFVAQLFEPFAQASTGERRTAVGLGLGLSIVRSLLQENDGDISYRRRDGRTCFLIDLPAARVSGP